ncbi:MAG: hypothetical protein ABI867_35265 [Kofleriaceae bacterium]
MRAFALLAAFAMSCGFGDNGSAATDVDAGPDRDARMTDAAPDPDGPTVECTFVPQTGCASGQACDFGDPDTGPHACRPITKPGTADSNCTLVTDCAAGFTCVESADTETSCDRLCEIDTDCGVGARCVNELEGEGGVTLLEKVCSNSCSILAQTGCPSGFGCVGIEDGANDFTDCAVMRDVPDGQLCDDSGDCLGGSVCVSSGGVGRCREFCNRGAAASCTVGTCEAFGVPLQIGGVNFGFCE